MEKTYNPALIQRTQRYMETHSISQNQFAAKVNLSSAALSSYLNVNGEIRGSWFVQDCEERRRFIPQKETSLMTRKQIAAYNKMPKKDRGPLKKFREETFTAYQTHWTNWQALVKH